MLSEYIKKLKTRNSLQDDARNGAVYSECEKQGCSRAFVQAFSARAELFPMKQTLAFLENSRGQVKNLKNWRTFLEALVKLKPEHEKCEEWKRSIKLLENED